ncbi:MAG: hypothetical protein IT426_02380 [Pirellulales bacterium]|nr:hypothetical protein [Pirellulales bacterium]
MGYIIGTDEAGYGPNLGPLVISATVWEAPEGIGGEGLFGALKGVVAGALPKTNGKKDGLPVFADSKILYASGKGLGNLERGLWAAWSLLGWKLRTWREVWERLAPDSREAIDRCPFYREYDQKLPRDFRGDSATAAPTLAGWQPALRSDWQAKFARTGVKLLAVRSRAVFPAEFNRLMDLHESKGAALSHLTLGLVAELMEPLEKGSISVLCDKHGGRDRYAALLHAHFSDGFVEVCREGRQSSTYRFGPPERRVEFQFRAKAESCLPAALASMAAKYLRELAMEAFNAFWTARVPHLAPTAGYPQDARRFHAEIAAKQRELGIDESILWRKK